MTMLVTDGGWDDPGAHHETIDIDVHTAAAYVVKPIPFGVDDAVATAIKQWQFTPAATRTSGVIAFRFEIVRFPRR